MAIAHAKPGEVVNVRPLAGGLATGRSETLVKTHSLEVIRVVLPAGKDIARHDVPGEITVQCLEGNVEFRIADAKRELAVGDFLYLEGADEHSLRANVDSSLLVTILLEHKCSTAKHDV